MPAVHLTLIPILVAVLAGCTLQDPSEAWKDRVSQQVNMLGDRNWIVVAEASFPAFNRPGFTQVLAGEEVPEVIEQVLTTLEQTENVRPNVFVARELRSVDNNFAPGIDQMRDRIEVSLHSLDTTELEQRSLITLVDSANTRYNVLVIRTSTALPYTSIFFELQPGYWDAESEDHLRRKLREEATQSLATALP